jgi:hypothetical protein
MFPRPMPVMAQPCQPQLAHILQNRHSLVQRKRNKNTSVASRCLCTIRIVYGQGQELTEHWGVYLGSTFHVMDHKEDSFCSLLFSSTASLCLFFSPPLSQVPCTCCTCLCWWPLVCSHTVHVRLTCHNECLA